MEKPCICGKKTLKNQPCWFEEARCGLPCGKKLKCGAHECRKPCHKPGECEDAGMSGTHCAQVCGKIRKSCEHTCTEQCHAPYHCKEDKPCQSKTFITCPCQRRKQEVRCQATKLNPWLTRESTLKCDDECLRLQRNRQLAEALSIDPETHSDDHIPYSDTTLKLFRENISWAQTQEREFRAFAAAQDEKRLRFKPMQAHQRAFLHALAEDFGLDSESQDPEPHRHVCVFKTPRFVSAPRKTLAQCLRIAKAASTLGAAASSLRPPASASTAPPKRGAQTFNALVLKNPRFALTIDELDQALAADLALASRTGPALTFTTHFLPSDEIVIKATPNTTTAAVAVTSVAPTAQALESALSQLKPNIARTVSRLGLAGAVSLCHVDVADGPGPSSSSSPSVSITRREGDSTAASNTGGWSAVASRGSWRRTGATAAAAAENKLLGVGGAGELRAPSAFVALKRLELRKKEMKNAAVEEDWLAAAERMDMDGEEAVEGKDAAEGVGGEGEIGNAGATGAIVALGGEIGGGSRVEGGQTEQEEGLVEAVAVDV
ncbi:FKBP12-associated protein [Madurella fahalii]|uniref:FKBP12-associated protein n=1 Tax=Madurella fahalii TaxID=1157608 RepID=A0ABQ0FXA3_9PEZI